MLRIAVISKRRIKGLREGIFDDGRESRLGGQEKGDLLWPDVQVTSVLE
jgi:hypothetical protein